MTLAQLAEKTGYDNSVLSRIEARIRKLDTEKINTIAAALNVQPHELLEDAQFSPHSNTTTVALKLVTVPIISWIQAGNFNGGESVNVATLKDIEETVTIPTNRLNGIFALRVEGDSMSLEAPHGAIIVVDTHDRDPIDGKLYVFSNVDHEATFKRYRDTDGPARLEPCSHDPKFRTIFPNGEINIIGRVTDIIRKV